MRVISFAALLATVTVFCGLAAAGQSQYAPITDDLSDPRTALKLMHDQGATGLSVEAVAYYQEGIEAARRGDRTAALTHLDTATTLDPALPEAYLALARLHFPNDLQGMVGDLLHAARATVSSFDSQHLLLVNVVFVLLLVAAFAGVLTVFYAAARLLPRVHHSMAEILQRWLPPLPAALVALLVLLAPALWRVGLVPILLLFGGMGWWWMSRGDRRWIEMLAALTLATPLLLWGFSPILYSPFDPVGTPHLMGQAMTAPYSEGLAEALQDARQREPENADLAFAEALALKRGGRFDEAEASYQDALRYGASEALAYNNLGVIAFQRGDYDRAIGLFDEAMSAEPGHAAPHYNMSLAYAKKLLFEKADEQMAEANRLALTRVRAALRHGIEGEESPLLDEPLPPAAMWAAAWAGPRRMPDLPRWMTPIFPGSLGALPFVSLAMLGLGLVLGRKIHLALPSFACTNCGRPVCRRCLRRIRRAAYCTPCGDALRRIQSTAYTKLVLDSRLRRGRSLTSILPQVADWALPGFRASRMGHPDLAALLAVGAGLGAAGLFNDNLPVTRLAWVDNGPSLWWPLLPGVLLFCAYLASTLTVLKLKPARTAVEEEEDELPLELPVQAERSRAA